MRRWRANMSPEKRAAVNAKQREANRRYYALHKDDPEFKARKSERDKKNYKPKPAASRRIHLRSKYNMTPEQAEAMRLAQHNLCAICDGEFTEPYHIDHCHDTGKVRGLLCRKCNTGLGMFSDDRDRLNQAIAYLTSHM